MKGSCKHFASAFASAKLALPAPADKNMGPLVASRESYENLLVASNAAWPLLPAVDTSHCTHATCYANPIIEEPDSPEPECNQTITDIEDLIMDIEDLCPDNDDEIPTIRLHSGKYKENSCSCWDEVGKVPKEMSKALIALPPEAASFPLPKLKNVARLRTEHQVYVLPDDHPLLESFERREPEDPCHYLFAIWGPDNIESAAKRSHSQLPSEVSMEETSLQEDSTSMENCETIRGTILIPCRTAMRSRFPLNGTYFQVNEVFADHESSYHPINVHRSLLWNLPRRTAFFGYSTSAILRDLSEEKIRGCFLEGFICVRGFDRKTRLSKLLSRRFHYPVRKKGGKAASAANDD